MSTDADTTAPTEHAIIANLDSPETVEAAIDAIADRIELDRDHVVHGSGEDFAHYLDGQQEDAGVLSRLIRLGQEHEALAQHAEAARAGREVLVINHVNTPDCATTIGEVLRDADARLIRYFGEWQMQDLDISTA